MSVCISPTLIGAWNLDAELQKELDALSARSHLSSSSSSAGDEGPTSEAKSEALLDAATNAKLDMLLNGWREKEKKLQEYEQSLSKIRLWQGDLDDRELRSKWLEDKSETGTAEHTDMMESTGAGTFETASKSTHENHDTQHQGELKLTVNSEDDKNHVTKGRALVESPSKVSSRSMDSSDTVVDHEGDLSEFEQDPLLSFQIRKRKMVEDFRAAELERAEELDRKRKAEAEESERRIALAFQRRQELEEEWQNEQKKKLASLEMEQNLKIRLFEELHRTEEIKLELEKQEMETKYKVLEDLSDAYRHMEDEQDLRRLDEDDETVKLMLSQAIQLQEQSNEATTEKRLSSCCTRIQSVVRGYLCRKKYKNLKSSSSYATLQKNIPPQSLGSGLEESSPCRGTPNASVEGLCSDQQSLDEVSTRLESLLETGTVEEIHSCLELARSLGLEEEASAVEDQLYQKQESMQNWLTQVINGWVTGRSNLQKQFEEASRLDLAPIYAVAEAVVFAREKEITEGLDMAIVTASRRDFHQWICKAKLMGGLDDAIRSSGERFLTRLKAVQESLRKESKLGSKDRYTLCFREAISLGLQSDTEQAVKAILKRILQFLRRATLLVGAKSNRRSSRTQDWKAVKTEAAQIGLDLGLVEFLKESIRRSRELEQGVTRVWITTYKVDETGMPCELVSTKHGSVPGEGDGDTECEVLVGSTDSLRARLLGSSSFDQKQQLIDDKLEQDREVGVTPHDWLEMLRLQRVWQQQHLENVNLEELRGSREDPGHTGTPDEVEEAEYTDDSHDTKQNLDSPHGLTTTTTKENCLTRKMLEENFNSDREKLRWVMSLDLISKGITSLGWKGLFRWCPRLKSLSVDLNKLTTFSQAFEGGQEELEQLSARENLLQSLTGLEGLQRLSVLHLDGNLLTQIIPRSQDGNEGHTTYAGICWSRLQVLTLSCNRLTDVSKLGHLCPNLEILDLGSNELLSLGRGEENALAGMQHLRVLDVGQNKLKGRSLWEGLKHCPELVSLVASRNHLTELPRHFGSVLLREIWLNGNAIEAFECKVWLPSLQRLYLQDNLITTLEPVWGCPALEVLDLSFNCIAECSQLQHLSCFPNLRSLQLNDNPVSDKEDHADYILQAVPWLQELDNEAVSKASRHQAISTIFKSVMAVAGVTFLQEKLTRGEALVRGFTNPCSAHKLSFNNREHNENRRSQFLNRSISEVNDVMNGEADEETLWAILLEVKELAQSSETLRTLLTMNGDRTKLGCLRIYSVSELEAKCTMAAYQQMACGLRSKLHAATKERSYRGFKETDVSELRTFQSEGPTDRGAESISNGASHLEWCLEEHSTFDPRDYTAIYTENTEYRLEAEAHTRRVIKLQALARRHMARIRVKSLINERNKRRERELLRRIVRVQAIWRGWTIRRQKILLHLHVEQTEKKLENAAAVSIQATWRGYITRLKFQQALRKSKYIDDDDFEYVRIDEKDFLAGESALATYQPAQMYLYAVGSDSTRVSDTSAKPNCSPQGTEDEIQEEGQKAELSKLKESSPVPQLDGISKLRIEKRTDYIAQTPMASSSDGNYGGESENLGISVASVRQIPVGSSMNCTKNPDPERIASFSHNKNPDSATCSTDCTNNESIPQQVEKRDEAAVIDIPESTEKDDLPQNAPVNSPTEEHASPDEMKRLDRQSLDDLLKKMGIPSPFPSRPSSVEPIPTCIPDIAVATSTDKRLDMNTSVDIRSQSTTERTESQARGGKKKTLSDEKAAVDLEEIAKDWGFKNTRTAEAYLKARERTMKQAKSAAQQNVLRDPETRFKLFKAKLGGPIPSRVAPLRQSESQAPSAVSDAEKHGKDCKNDFREQPSNGGFQTSVARPAHNRRSNSTRMLSLPLSSITNASTETKATEMKKDTIHKDVKRASISGVQGGLSPWQIPKLNLNASLYDFRIRDAQETKR